MKNVRVEVELDEYCRSYGISGTCSEVDEVAQELVILDDKVTVRVPIQAVVLRTERQCQSRDFFSFKTVAQIKKRCMMYEVSGWDPESSIPLTPVSQGKPIRLDDEHLRMWHVVLRSTFPNANFKWFDPSIYLHRLFSDPTLELTLQEGIRRAFQKVDLLLFPLQCPESDDHPIGHWTLLAIERTEDIQKSLVRYYETMNDMNEICFSKALKILSILDLPQDGFDRCNKFRQKSDECTEVVMHYVELEIRHIAGEGWGTVRCLHPNHRTKMRQTLSRFQSNLEPVRLEWVKQSEIEEIQKKYLNLAVEKKVGKVAMAELELMKLRKLSETVAELIHEHNPDLPRLELPKVEKKAKAKAAVQAKAKVEKSKAKAESKPATDEPGSASNIEIWGPPEPDLLDDLFSEEPAPEQGPVAPAPEQDVTSGCPGPEQEGSMIRKDMLSKIAALSDLMAREPTSEDEVEPAETPGAETPGAETPAAETPAPETPVPETPVPDVQPPEAAEVESLELKVAEAEESAIVEVSALTSAGALAEPEVLHADELDEETEQKLSELFSANNKFDTWVRSVSLEQKEKIIEFHYKSHENFQEFNRYLRYVKDNQTVEGCSKCRYDLTGCLKCTISKAQNYILRNGKLPVWWKTKDPSLK